MKMAEKIAHLPVLTVRRHEVSAIIIIISHLLHENKSQVLTIEMADMQMEQARSYELIQGLVPRAG